MAHIDGPILAAFMRATHSVQQFTEEEMERLRQIAEELKRVMDSAESRVQH
jgi:hypothetical protein